MVLLRKIVIPAQHFCEFVGDRNGIIVKKRNFAIPNYQNCAKP